MHKDKQILIVSDFTYPNYAGGISRHVYDVCRHMKALKIPVKLISKAKISKHDFEMIVKLSLKLYRRIVEKSRSLKLL